MNARRALIIALIVATIVGYITAVMVALTPTHAATRPDPTKAGVYVIGDSITRGVHLTALSPENRPNDWHVDGVGGRRMTALGETYVSPHREHLSRQRIFNTGGVQVRTAVLALGTNGADARMTIPEAEAYYVEAIRRVKWHTGAKRVILVTAWRDPARWSPGSINPRTGEPVGQHTYGYHAYVNSHAMWNVAAQMRGVCVMNWRGYISRHVEQTTDGVHPTKVGRVAWRDLLYRTIRQC